MIFLLLSDGNTNRRYTFVVDGLIGCLIILAKRRIPTATRVLVAMASETEFCCQLRFLRKSPNLSSSALDQGVIRIANFVVYFICIILYKIYRALLHALFCRTVKQETAMFFLSKENNHGIKTVPACSMKKVEVVVGRIVTHLFAFIVEIFLVFTAFRISAFRFRHSAISSFRFQTVQLFGGTI